MAAQPIRVAIDLETTGLLAEQDSIIEIGAVKFAGSDVLETFERFVAPRQPLPYRIQRLTGIRPADLAGAPPLTSVLPELRSFLGDYPLVGHSVPFDAAFLRHAGLVRRNPLVDTYELASALLPNLPSYTLEAVSSALGVASPTYHRALADAVLARDVLLALLVLLDGLDSATLRLLARLRVSGDWSPTTFVRATLRARGDHGTGTLGDLLADKLGLDPAVLGLAVARVASTITTASAALSPVALAPLLAPANPSILPIPADANGDSNWSPSTQIDASHSTVWTLSPRDIRDRSLQGRGQGERTPLLATSLTRCLEDGGTTLLEAPESPETHAACLQALLAWTARTGERALVAVADAAAVARTARTQLPAAHAALNLPPDDLSVAELLEPDAYLCLHRWFGAASQPRDGTLSRELARGLAKLIVWASDTHTGSRAEVSLNGQELVAWERARAGREFADSWDDCSYRKRGYCFVARARDAAAFARIVVTTHAALAADLAGPRPHLPAIPRVLILDAHRLDDELRRALSWSLERRTLQTLLATLADADGSGSRSGLLHLFAQRGTDAPEASWFAQVARARTAGDAFFAALAHLQTSAQRGNREPRAEAAEQSVHLNVRVRQSESWLEVASAWTTLEGRLRTVARLVGEIGARAAHSADGRRGAIAADGIATDLLAARRSIEDLCARLHSAVGDECEGMVVWLRTAFSVPTRPDASANANGSGVALATPPPLGGDTPALYVAPVTAGDLLAPLQRSDHALALVGSSLAIGGDFEYSLATLNLPASTPTRAIGADHSTRTLLLLPEDISEPNAPAFQHQLDEALIALAGALGGRTIVLFPSHAALRATAPGIRRALEARDILLMAQGLDGSVRQLWQTFRTQPRVVLLATGTFWDGAAVEGTPPACVVVARLPFPSLSDPLLAARAATWPDQQAQFVVPHATLRMRQALNGLAWSHGQRNAVVIFDHRLLSRSYGATVLGSLPPCTQRTIAAAQLAGEAAAWVDVGSA